MKEIETKDYRTFYANHVVCTATDHEAILRLIRTEPCNYVEGIPQDIQLLVESQVVMNIPVLEELHRTLTAALAGLKKPNNDTEH